MKHTFDYFRKMLRRGVDDPQVQELTGTSGSQLKTYEQTGYVDLRNQGVSVIFKFADRVVQPNLRDGDDSFLISAFHFHSDGHEGHSGYFGELPAQLSFGDDENSIKLKLGIPHEEGGGGFSKVLRKPIPRWLRYHFEQDICQLQLSAEGRLEMVTLFVQDQLQPL